ncbi:hypothetical protein ABW20_dc0106415 [Dactylellina cionopaga]|nr:hypothetical protein ABW20_dc0106415 [Dactylellina cionopaga]
MNSTKLEAGPVQANNMTDNNGEYASKLGGFQDIRLSEDPTLERRTFNGRVELSVPKIDGGVRRDNEIKGAKSSKKEENADKNAVVKEEITHKEGAGKLKQETNELAEIASKPSVESTHKFEVDLNREYEENVGIFCGDPGTGVLFKVDKEPLKRESGWFREQIGDKEMSAFQVDEEPTLVKLMLQYVHLGDFDECAPTVPHAAVELNANENEQITVQVASGTSGRLFCNIVISERLKALMEISKKYGIPGLGKLAASKFKTNTAFTRGYQQVLIENARAIDKEIQRIDLIVAEAQADMERELFKEFYTHTDTAPSRDLRETNRKVLGLRGDIEKHEMTTAAAVQADEVIEKAADISAVAVPGDPEEPTTPTPNVSAEPLAHSTPQGSEVGNTTVGTSDGGDGSMVQLPPNETVVLNTNIETSSTENSEKPQTLKIAASATALMTQGIITTTNEAVKSLSRNVEPDVLEGKPVAPDGPNIITISKSYADKLGIRKKAVVKCTGDSTEPSYEELVERIKATICEKKLADDEEEGGVSVEGLETAAQGKENCPKT